MIPNAIALARELAGRKPHEREEYYERAGLPSTIRAEVEALLSGPAQHVPPVEHAEKTILTPPIAAHKTFIGRYEVIRLLGRGGMAEVFLAHDPVLDREVAVKLIRAGVDDPGARQRLVQEARAAGRLRHPNIVTLFDAGDHEGSLYIAMEHLGGETLRSLIHRRAELTLARRLELIEGACAGLAHAHRANVVHFDVKPDNLMLDTTGVIKVLDFGIARILQSDVLVTQSVVGTLRYMSPEQINGGPLDRRCDVFSIGCSLFELVTYKPPYAGSAHELVARIAGGPVPRMSSVMPSVDSRLDALVARAMALDPIHRFDDLDELAAALVQVRLSLGGPDSARLTSAAVPAEAAPRRRAVVAAGALAVVALVGGTIWMTSSGTSPEGGTSAALSPSDPPAPTTGTQPSAPPAAEARPSDMPEPPSAPPSAATTAASVSSAAGPGDDVWRRLARGDRAGVVDLLQRQGANSALAREVFESVRQTVIKAAASAHKESPAFKTADERFNHANALAASRQPIAALSEIWSAADLYASTSADARSAPAPPPQSVPADPAATARGSTPATHVDPPRTINPAPTAPIDSASAGLARTPADAAMPPPPVNETANVRAVLRRYASAYKALDVTAVQQVYPDLGRDELERVRRNFANFKSYDLEIPDTAPVEIRNNTTALVRASVAHRVIPNVGVPTTSKVETEYRLRREAGGWIITGISTR